MVFCYGILNRIIWEGRHKLHIYIHICVCVCVYIHTHTYTGFPGSSAGKESTFNAGDPSFTPVSGRSTGEEIG